MKPKALRAALALVLLFSNIAYAWEGGQIYSMAIREARSGNIDAAFMYFRSLLTDFPDSKYTENALFAIGEYYFLIADYIDATEAFTRYIEEYQNSPNMVFALMYLLKIAEMRGEESLVRNLEKKIVTLRRVSLLFKESKTYKYLSAFYRKYRVAYYIDRVEFYIDGRLFAKISY